jgi:hypothetical protein
LNTKRIIAATFLLLVVVVQRVSSQDNPPCGDQPLLIFSRMGALQPDQSRLRFFCQEMSSPVDLGFDFDAISQDGRWTVRVDYSSDPHELEVSDFGRDVPEAVVPWKPEWLSWGVYWFDNDHLAIALADETGEDSGHRIILNPWTEETLLIGPSLSDKSQDFVYNPILTQVVYTLQKENAGRELQLYDLQEERIMWERSIGSLTPPFSYFALWSSDSTEFIYTRPIDDGVTFELFLVNRTGQETQITNLSNSGVSPSLVDAFAWSPNKRYIAFWWLSSKTFMPANETFKLKILDIETGVIEGVNLFHWHGGAFDIVWSPDSNSLAVIHGTVSNEQILSIVDVKTHHVEQIAEHVSSVTTWCDCLLPAISR